MHTAITKLGATILVVQNDNDPLSNYEVPPTGIHDSYGPIALYGGDPENMVAYGSFGVTAAFLRVPQPEYDPHLTEQKPPMDAPLDDTCLYCYQPPIAPGTASCSRRGSAGGRKPSAPSPHACRRASPCGCRAARSRWHPGRHR